MRPSSRHLVIMWWSPLLPVQRSKEKEDHPDADPLTMNLPSLGTIHQHWHFSRLQPKSNLRNPCRCESPRVQGFQNAFPFHCIIGFFKIQFSIKPLVLFCLMRCKTSWAVAIESRVLLSLRNPAWWSSIISLRNTLSLLASTYEIIFIDAFNTLIGLKSPPL